MKIKNLFFSLTMLLAFGIFAVSCSEGGGPCVSDLTDEELEGDFIGKHTLGISNAILKLLLPVVNEDRPDTAKLTIDDLKFYEDTLSSAEGTVYSAILDLALDFEKGCGNEIVIEQFTQPSLLLSGGVEIKNAKISGTATLDGDVLTTKLKVSGLVADLITIQPTNVTGTFTRTDLTPVKKVQIKQ